MCASVYQKYKNLRVSTQLPRKIKQQNCIYFVKLKNFFKGSLIVPIKSYHRLMCATIPNSINKYLNTVLFQKSGP